MSNRGRAGVLALAVVIVVVAFVVLRPSSNDDKKSDSAATTTTATGGAKASGPDVERITLKGGAPVGGARNIKVKKGDDVRLVVETDEPTDTLHLHGYDIEKDAKKGAPAQFRFKAKVEGVFELESHTAEHAGRDPLIAHLVVEPS